MILFPLLNINLRPIINCWIKQSRNIRPSVKIGKEKFEITLDVRQFKKDEIKVKARPEYVVIQGKQERNTKRGYIIRQFVRKFKLPDGCCPENMTSRLSPDGILTITAARKVCDASFPCETVVPVRFAGPEKNEESLIPVEKDKCPSDKKEQFSIPVEKNKCPPDEKNK